MKIYHLLVRGRFLLTKFSKTFEDKKHFLKKLNFLKVQNMTGRKLENETGSDIPEKKLCTEEVKQSDTNGETSIEKRKKKKVALLLGYCGTNYYGMQVNPNMRTVEQELLMALFKANCIPEEAINQTNCVLFQRAARTDKGVSAAKQVVSLKLALDHNIEEINSCLPDDIKVFSIKRTTKGFNSKRDCGARTYSYTLPTYALAPEFFSEFPKDFRVSQEIIDKTNAILSQFIGSKVFHNFTCKKEYKDPSARRYILNFSAGEPFVDGIEFITLTVKGQSFMLYQIRKMVGYTLALLKKLQPIDFEADVWSEKKCGVPTAPGLGLILENVHYDRYNKKFGNDGMHADLSWSEVEDEVEKFKKSHILPVIINTENEEKPMFHWLQNLHLYDFSEDRDRLEGNKEDLKDTEEE